MPPKQDPVRSLKDQLCKVCNVKVVDPVLCPECAAPYHPSSTETRTKMIDGVGYMKCCGPASTSVPTSKLDELSNGIKALAAQMSQGFGKVNLSVRKMQNDLTSLGRRLDSTDKKVDNTIGRLTTVDTKIENLEKQPASDQSEYLLSEFELRLKAKSNVVVFGLPESIINDKVDINTDNIPIAKLLNILISQNQTILTNDVRSFRIGNFSTSRPNPRPVKIICRSTDQATAILTSSKAIRQELINSPQFKGVVFASDRTRIQQEAYRKLKLELQNRKLKGETNPHIKYINGQPKIVPNSINLQQGTNIQD